MLFFYFFPIEIYYKLNMSCFKTYALLFSNPLIWTCMCFALSINIEAQVKDTITHQLIEIPIIENKQQIFETSKKTSVFDSLTLARYNTSSLSDLLSNQSTIHVKQLGNGNIATTSIRGGHASHTALLWNGLNIQNAMLGQPDLSIVPSYLFNNISIEYGGGSAIWGSGAMGGSIHLKNNIDFNQGFKTSLQIGAGSFDTKKINSGVILSYKKIASKTTIYFCSSKNDYKYIDTTDKENPNKKALHANYSAKGLMQEISFLLNSFQKIDVRLWYNEMDRNIPLFTGLMSTKKQLDKNLKLNTEWNYHKKKLNSVIRLGYFNDKLNYNDTLSSYTVSNNKINTIIAESDNIYHYRNNHFNFGVNFTNYNSELFSSINMKDTIYHHSLNKIAFFGAYKLSLLNSKLNYNLAIRKEFTSQSEIPFTGNTGIHYQLLKQLAAKINANTSYRQPSLSDLYWNPGGNPNLKPEESNEIEGGLELNYTKGHFNALIDITYFNRHTTNWIMWLPRGQGHSVPKNIAEVYSRGLETKTELSYFKKEFFVKIILNTSYVLSTNQKATSENDNSVGRQLIFTPRYNGQGTLLVKYKNINLLFNNNYTGYRFTSTDNTSWIAPYYIANFKCSYNYSYDSVNSELFFNVNNIFNKNYSVMQNNPMPLRNYEIGIGLKYNKKKKVETTIN